MSTFGSTSAASSTAQQDRVASGNSQHARRSSGDNKVFANMLSAAAENTAPEPLTEARKKEPNTRDEGERQPDADAAAWNTPLAPSASKAATSEAEAAAQESSLAPDEADNQARRPARGGRSPLSTLALAGRESAAALRNTRGAGATPDHGADPTSVGTTAQLVAPNNAAGAAGKPLVDSLVTALAAALDDALDVSDDVTLTTSVALEHLGGADGHTDAHAELAAVSDSHRSDADAPAGTEAPQAQAEAWQNAWTDAMDRVGQQVSYWLGKGVSQAQLTVHGSQGEAVDVRVLLRDGQAHLEFLSNNEATRAALAHNGAETLRAVLGQSGIELASLSVDAQASGGQHQNGQAPAQERTMGALGAGAAAADPDQDDTSPPGRVVHWTSRSVLDAYA